MASHSDPAKQPAATELQIMLIKQVERTSAEPQLLQLYHSSHSTLTRDWSVRLPSFTSFYRLSRLFLWDNSCRSRWRDLTLHYSPMLKRSRKPCERHKGRAKGREMKCMLEKVKKARGWSLELPAMASWVMEESSGGWDGGPKPAWWGAD